MSCSKIWFEEGEADAFARCADCGEYEDECICGDVATEGHVVFPATSEDVTLAGTFSDHANATE